MTGTTRKLPIQILLLVITFQGLTPDANASDQWFHLSAETEHWQDATISKLSKELPKEDKPLGSIETGSWVKIPKWLAGEWKYLSCQQLGGESGTGAASIQTDHPLPYTENFGQQLDGSGQIWTLVKDPFPTIDSLGTKDSTQPQRTLVFRQINSVQIEGQKANLLITRLMLLIDQKTKKIVENRISKSAVTYTLLKPGLIAITANTQFLDRQGKLLSEEESVAILKSIASFKQINEVELINLKASFVRFLEESGRADLTKGI